MTRDISGGLMRVASRPEMVTVSGPTRGRTSCIGSNPGRVAGLPSALSLGLSGGKILAPACAGSALLFDCEAANRSAETAGEMGSGTYCSRCDDGCLSTVAISNVIGGIVRTPADLATIRNLATLYPGFRSGIRDAVDLPVRALTSR